MLVLGIETTCDETAAAVVRDGEEILSSVIASQALVHEKYGGVFPEVAARLHVDAISVVIQKAMLEAGIQVEDIDLIAVAKGPGLVGAILIGLSAAKSLSIAWEKPFIGVNHIEAHLYGAMMGNPRIFPALGVIVSGGHTLLLKMEKVNSYEILGRTIDDAIGEAFDKVAVILGLSYPGGPLVEKLAEGGDVKRFPFRGGKTTSPLDFSFSGLKTNVLYTSQKVALEDEKKNLAASFQDAALKDVLDKSLKAINTFNCRAVYIGGGVSNNQVLRRMFKNHLPLPFFFPQKGLSLDNAAMIAGLGAAIYQEKPDGLDLFPILDLYLK